MTCGLNRQSLMNISSSWKNQQAITTKKPKPATLVQTKLNAREISAMTVKCTFCNDTKQEPGEPGRCVWCEEVEPVTLGTVTRYAESCGEGGGVVEHASGQYVEFKNYEAALAREAALREDLDKANDKIDKAWNLSHALDHQGFIPGALDAWKRPVKQHLHYDFSGNPGASAIQYCNGWNDSGGYWSAHAKDLQQRLTVAEQRVQRMVECSKGRDSVATGYLSDILALLKPAAEGEGS